MRHLLSPLLLLLALWQLGCANHTSVTRIEPLPAGGINPSASDGLATDELSRAAKLSVTKCARCHKLYSPLAYTDAEWQRWVSKMRKRARLNPDQEQLLIRYRQSLRP